MPQILSDTYTVYDFYVQVALGDHVVDIEHAVLPVTGPYQHVSTQYANNSWDNIDENSTVSVLSGEPDEKLSDANAQLVIDTIPQHGTLEVDTGSGYIVAQAGTYPLLPGTGPVLYSPYTNYTGPDHFSYRLTYNELDYWDPDPCTPIGQAVTNVGTQYFQVGPWVDVQAAAADTYADSQGDHRGGRHDDRDADARQSAGQRPAQHGLLVRQFRSQCDYRVRHRRQ